MEDTDRLRKIVQAAKEDGIFEGTGGHWELHHLLVLDQPIEVPVIGEANDRAKARDSFVRTEDYWGENTPVVEAKVIGAPYGERTAWAFIFEEDGVGIYDLAPSAFYGPGKPLYMQTMETGGTYYTREDISAALGGEPEDSLVKLDEPDEFQLTVKFIDYRDGQPWALTDEGEFPVDDETDWEEKGEVIDR